MYITTEQLQNRLAHCYGKDTVTVTHYNGNNFIFHYNALICVINDQRVIFNIPYYDYSGATSRVRNRACEMILGKSWTTRELRRHLKGNIKIKNVYFARLLDYRIYDYINCTYRIYDYTNCTYRIYKMIEKGAFDLI